MRRIGLIPLLLLALSASPAYADVTAFIGSTTTPVSRSTRGVAVGVGLLVVGFEFEYANTGADEIEMAPQLRTGMGNVLIQTPFPIAGLQFYATAGGGLYRETLGDTTHTQLGANTGGGVKISLIGPLRARLDYRVFKLHGDALHPVVHRVYAGVNLKF
jgi:hypothetical protein